MLTRFTITTALVAATTCAFAQLPGQPAWRDGAEAFTGRDGIIYADHTPFLLIYDFTWSAKKDARFYEFSEDWGGTATHERPEAYDDAADHHIFLGWSGSVGHDGSYIREHPDAAMITADGEPARRSQVCYLHEGYREHLRDQLIELAESLRDRPFQMGYYPQDEFAYRSFGGYNPICIARFRDWLKHEYGTIGALNEAWESDFADFDAVEPPREFENSRRFCDWQQFRRWMQMDFAKLVYDTLKEADPDHAVIWSLPFWGDWRTAAGWWDFPEVSDILMRHGIGYRTGAYRIHMLRDVAEWSGVPGNALAMPPDYNPGYVQMSFLMDCPRTGLSHVCFAGSPDPTYQGVANSDERYARREPMYTVSRSINNVQYQLGDLYLLSQQRAPQVGVYVSDRTVLVNGTNTRNLSGLLNLLYDLNIDFQIFSEYNLGDLSRYPAIVAAECSRVVSDEIAARFRDYVAEGGNLVMLDGAFAADWYNRDVGNPGHGFGEVIGSTEAERASTTAAMAIDAAGTGLQDLPARAPVVEEVSIREPSTATVIGTVGEGLPVATLNEFGEGSALYLGADVGLIYYSSWTEGYRDVLQTDERAQAIDDNAYGYDYRPPTGPEVEPAKGAKAWAELLRGYLRSRGIGDNVVVEGYTDGVGVLKVKSFRQGDSYWVGLANRLVEPGADHRETPPEELHQTLSDLRVRVRLDEGTAPEVAWVLPNTRRTGGGRAAVPGVLPVEIVKQDGARWASFTLPELIDFAAVGLLPRGRRQAVMGISTDREAITAGETVTATATIINTSAEAISGAVRPGLEAGLEFAEGPAQFELAAGQQATRSFKVTAPVGLEPDYYQINMVAEIGGKQVVSPPVEVQVMRDIIITADTDRTIFPMGHLEPVMPVNVKVNTIMPSDLSVAVELPEGFGAEQARFELDPLKDGQEQTVEFRFTTDDDTPRVEGGTLTVAGELRGDEFSRSYPIRLAVGTVIYHKSEEYKTHATMVPEPMQLLAMENSHVLATFIERNGVVHDLVLRDTDTDHLVPTAYPFGWVWYGFDADWRVEEISDCGQRVWARVVGRHPEDGTPITMMWSLQQGANHITIDIDTGEAGPVESAFYLMSRIGIDGNGERSIWPTADGLKSLEWRGGCRDVPAEELSQNWMAVQDDATGQTFGCIYSFPSLDRVRIFPGNNNFNYMIFYPDPEVPIGDITFALSATLGEVDRVQELYQQLNLQ